MGSCEGWVYYCFLRQISFQFLTTKKYSTNCSAYCSIVGYSACSCYGLNFHRFNEKTRGERGQGLKGVTTVGSVQTKCRSLFYLNGFPKTRAHTCAYDNKQCLPLALDLCQAEQKSTREGNARVSQTFFQ